MNPLIQKCTAREILDSRGNPTVEAVVYLEDGTVGIASVPSGASTGHFEAHEKKDGDPNRYNGKGVTEAVLGVKRDISKAISGIPANDQYRVDQTLCAVDGSENKSNLGANAILAVSLATARAASNYYRIPLYRYLGGMQANRLPIPMMNVLNGGAHASNNIEIQEFMLVPVGSESFSDAVRICCEIYQNLKSLLLSRSYETAVGDEGGFAPNLSSDEEALDLLCESIHRSGYDDCVSLAIDAAASEWYTDRGEYRMPKHGNTTTRTELIEYWARLCEHYPILSIEDGLDEEDFEGWSLLTKRLGNEVMLVGDDLFVTNSKRLRYGIEAGAANAVLVKPNQIGTLSETLDLIETAKANQYRFVLSHRSGETEDTTIADLSVATGAPYIKSGAPCRGERVAKYNRLLRIEGFLEGGKVYGEERSVYRSNRVLKNTHKQEALV